MAMNKNKNKKTRENNKSSCTIYTFIKTNRRSLNTRWIVPGTGLKLDSNRAVVNEIPLQIMILIKPPRCEAALGLGDDKRLN